MGVEAANNPVDDPINSSTRSCPSKKHPGKVPRKIHKAEREKMKRDSMNDLFLDLEKTLGLDQPNNGKASILRSTVRLLGGLLAQVENLKKENVALVSESNYVASEKNELVEETSALDDQIKTLQREIDERGNCVNSDFLQPITNESTHVPENHVPIPLIGHASESTPILAPVFVMPLCHEPEGFTEANVTKSSVSRPRPRYPSSSDIWPSHILAKQTNVTDNV